MFQRSAEGIDDDPLLAAADLATHEVKWSGRHG
jgi:hypothetical protein